MIEGILDFCIFLFGTKMENKIKNSGIETVKKRLLYVLLSFSILTILLIFAWVSLNI